MHQADASLSDPLLLWILVLLTLTSLQFAWRCHRAGVLAIFGRRAASSQMLLRLTTAASVPALLCSGWFALSPAVSDWAWLGTAHLALAWYGLRWLLPDGLAWSNATTAI